MQTKWANIIQVNRKMILDQWLERSLALFPATMGPRTPVAEVLADALERILSELEKHDGDVPDALNDVTRILAVQEFAPSKAISIFFEPKVILHEMIKKSNVADTLTKEVQEAFHIRIDALVLAAFDSYMRHREKIYQLKVEESSRRMHMALRRAEV
jgi:hypothetical protein